MIQAYKTIRSELLEYGGGLADKKEIVALTKSDAMEKDDDGAAKALTSGKSLLSAGVVKVEGEFQHGDPVEIRDKDGKKRAFGLMAYSANEARLILGCKSSDISGSMVASMILMP